MLSIEPSKSRVEPRCAQSGRQVTLEVASSGENTFRLAFTGDMTLANCPEFEEKIVDALRRYPHLELDLSGIREIDLYGIHLLGLLQRVADRKVVIVASSPAVEDASRHLVAPSVVGPVESC